MATCYVAEHPEKNIVLSHEISQEYDIPIEYLLKILQQLVKGNILRSKRGPRGGFRLARPANKITMLQIIEAADGPMVSYLNLADYTPRGKACNRADKVFAKALSLARDVFQKTKLSDLIAGK
jgi:Rrf2 family protein